MQVEQNRIYFGKLVSYIRWFYLQEVAFRGEEEHDVGSAYRGNFRELLEIEFELHPEFLAQKKSIMEQYSIYTDYLSKTVYEEFISIMAREIRKIIAREIAQTKFYTLVLDEAKDVSGYEQLCLCVRYCSGTVPAERLMGLIRLSEGLSSI
ncbi:hypothetical protein LOD99_12064 [Oopsacas minuta]|uniref:DUF4371 domain-containing protein n=1 Tax=Oopsacas minuta TaxID=111878 RepID=A0AAV7JHC2_9METZ|nr:hypothetical protein LOD99_12064 [Oopsacas minuta]